MRARLLAVVLFVLSSGAAVAQVPMSGFTSSDCATFLDVEALGGELYAVKFAGNNDVPDILYDASASGGGQVVASLTQDNWNINAQWRTPVSSNSKAVAAITLPNRVIIDNTDFTSAVLGTAKPQDVGSIDGIKPDVVATPFGFEVRFKALRQQTTDEVPDCSTAGNPFIDLRPVIGYAIYRLPGSGAAALSQYRTSGYVGFADVRSQRPLQQDADGFGCADGATPDETRFINPNGVMDDGDEIIVFRDTTRTPGGTLRATAPNATLTYTYRVQPILRGDPSFYASGGVMSQNNVAVSSADRDGNTTHESIDLQNDGRYEFVDPGMHGLGLTWNGEILSSPQPGQATPIVGLNDADGDGIPGIAELGFGLNPNVSNAGLDTDGDGPQDRLEAESGANPASADSDGAGERDGREMFYGRSPLNTCDDIVLGARPLGDVAPAGGGDGVVNVADAVRMLRLAVTIETPTAADVTAGDVAPAEETNASTNPPTWRRHATTDPGGNYPFGYYEHGDGVLNVQDAVIILRKSVGLLTVTD